MHSVANSHPRNSHFSSSGHPHNKVKAASPTKKGQARNELRQRSSENCSKPSLKRSRSLAQSTQTHNLNGMTITLLADDSPKSHFVGMKIVTGVEDDQVAPPRRRFLSNVIRVLSQPAPGEDPSECTLSDRFEGHSEVSSSREGISPRPDSLCLNGKLANVQEQNIASSLVVHYSGIETSNDWDRPQTVFQESSVSFVPPPTTARAEMAISPPPDREHSVSLGAEESSHHESLHPAEMSSSLFCGGHESEISIDPLNNFSPRKSTRAKAAAARRAAVVEEKLLEQKETVMGFGDSSVRHKSFESINHESKGGRSQYSRYDESLLLRKSRRDEPLKTKIQRKVRKESGGKDPSPPRETSNMIGVFPKDFVKSCSPVAPIMEERDHRHGSSGGQVISGDSSFTLGHKSSSQEFAQLDLGDQQGIRMVNRSQILTEEDGGLHERKAVVDVSPPPEARASFSGLLRSKMATFRSASSRALTESNNATAQSPDDAGGAARPNLRHGLALFRSQSSRCITKPSVSEQVPQRSNNDTSPKGGVVGLALRNHFTNFRAPRVEDKQVIPEDKSIALDEGESGVVTAAPRASLFSNNLLTRLNESFSANMNLNGAALLDDDESSFGFPQ